MGGGRKLISRFGFFVSFALCFWGEEGVLSGGWFFGVVSGVCMWVFRRVVVRKKGIGFGYSMIFFGGISA